MIALTRYLYALYTHRLPPQFFKSSNKDMHRSKLSHLQSVQIPLELRCPKFRTDLPSMAPYPADLARLLLLMHILCVLSSLLNNHRITMIVGTQGDGLTAKVGGVALSVLVERGEVGKGQVEE